MRNKLKKNALKILCFIFIAICYPNLVFAENGFEQQLKNWGVALEKLEDLDSFQSREGVIISALNTNYLFQDIRIDISKINDKYILTLQVNDNTTRQYHVQAYTEAYPYYYEDATVYALFDSEDICIAALSIYTMPLKSQILHRIFVTFYDLNDPSLNFIAFLDTKYFSF
jgi:hypothetical protein